MLTLPAQLLVLFIAVFPLLMQLYISLTDWSPLDGIGWWQAYESWNTFANYTDLAADGRFWNALGRTAFVMLICVPAEFLHDAHHWLILHGRYVCKARKPDCPRCVIRDLCHWPDKTAP